MEDPDNRRDWTSGTGLEKKAGDMGKPISELANAISPVTIYLFPIVIMMEIIYKN